MAEKFGIKYEDSKVKKQGGLDREILEWIQEKEGGIANEYLYFNECSISEKGIQVIVKDNKDTVIIFSLSLALEKCKKENEYDQIVLIAKQLQEMFPKICGVDKYQYDINGGDYTIDGRQKWRIAFVLKKESVEEKNIINYNFHRIEVSLDENNNVYSITIHNENLNNKKKNYYTALRYYECLILAIVCYIFYVIDFIKDKEICLIVVINILWPLSLVVWEVLVTNRIMLGYNLILYLELIQYLFCTSFRII